MSKTRSSVGADHAQISLGEVSPARSRHAGRRSAVAVTADTIVVGMENGTIRAFDQETLTEQWRSEAGDAAAVAMIPFNDGIAVGERGPEGQIRVHDIATGAVKWRYRSADDVGDPVAKTRFQLPFVASLTVADNRLYAAARRYERIDGERCFESCVYAFEPDGTLAWIVHKDASPIALDADAERVAVAYNRCPGAHQHGLIVLDAASGCTRWTWDPGTDGDRRVGDVSLYNDDVVVTSHGDYRGYRLGAGGREQWRVDLATLIDSGDERLYAYPNHVHALDESEQMGKTSGDPASDAIIVFVTGNTYAVDTRETEQLHPDEHTAFGYTATGEQRWRKPIGGFAGGIGAHGDRVAVPGAQHFRERDPDVHGVRMFDVATGNRQTLAAEGVVTAVALGDNLTAAIEEPVAYHDGDGRLGEYRLHRHRF